MTNNQRHLFAILNYLHDKRRYFADQELLDADRAKSLALGGDYLGAYRARCGGSGTIAKELDAIITDVESRLGAELLAELRAAAK